MAIFSCDDVKKIGLLLGRSRQISDRVLSDLVRDIFLLDRSTASIREFDEYISV